MGLMQKVIGSGDGKDRTEETKRPGNSEIGEGALDTLGCVLRTMGDISFPLENESDSDAFRAKCSQFACHVENGAPISSVETTATSDGTRQWGHVRRFFIDRRTEEKAFVTERLGDYRGVVEDLVDGLRQAGQRDQDTEQSVRDDLGSIETAVDTGELPQIKTVLSKTVQNITETFAQKKKAYETQIKELNDRMSGLRQDLVAAREEMKRDTLTNAYNRGAFDTAIVQSLNTHFILNQPVTLVLIDLDNFKEINDTYGHAAGDEVLRAMGDCLARSFIRKSDFTARYGGDEFAVILSDTTSENSISLIERFMHKVGEITVPYASDDVNVGCSIGFTQIHDDDSTQTLIERADSALYEAKAAGRNCHKYAPPPE